RARSERSALNGAHDWLHEGADAEQDAPERLGILAIGFAGGAQCARQRLEVRSDAEIFAVGRELDDADVAVLLELRACGEQLRCHFAIDHVTTLWAGKNDPTDGALPFQPNPRHYTAPGSPSFLASESGTSIVIRRSAVENTLPCASVFRDNVPPPSSAPCNRKLRAPRFGSSKRSTSPVMTPLKCRATASRVTNIWSNGYSRGSRAIKPTF